MDALTTKLAERAELTAQMTALATRMATLDDEILSLYEHQNPREPDSEFIIQARKDCDRVLNVLRGAPYRLLTALLDSRLGIVDYDATVDSVWPDGLPNDTTVNSTVYYVRKLLKTRTKRYTIHSRKHGIMQLDPENVHK